MYGLQVIFDLFISSRSIPYVYSRGCNYFIAMQNTSIYKVILIFTGLILLNCSSPAEKASKLHVFVTIPPQKYFLEKIGKDLVQINTLIPPGASPHSYEPKPSQLTGLSRTKLFFAIGGDFEGAWLPRICKDLSGLKVVFALNEHSGAQSDKCPNHDHDHHRHSQGHDPHIWLSPEQVLHMADIIAIELSAADSVNRDQYLNNCSLFKDEIRDLQNKIRANLNGCTPGHPFMVFHPSWGHFASEFDLSQISVEIDGKEPGMREMQNIIDIAEKKKIRTIFVQPQFSKRSAQTISDQLKLKVSVADPLAENWAENLLKISEALGKE
ncbi:MAG: zinc ABC transporter solute-binding protein [Fibrobacter sp.]|nr:zinc ABC transporter solute-binding protein [Fibrobacter sp.]